MLRRLLRWSLRGLLLIALLLAAIYLSLRPPAPLSLPPQGGTLTSVVLVVPGESRSETVDLTVAGGVITAIAPAAGPVRGYVLPGLIDAHMHGPMLPFPGEESLYAFLHLYHGVTGARMASGTTSMREAVTAGDYPGPRLHVCGPFVDGEPPLWRGSLVVTDEASADSAVASIQSGGFDCVKVYNELTAPASEAVYRAAGRAGLPVIGHVPWRQDATAAFIDDQQHLLGLPPQDPDVGPGQSVWAMQRIGEVDAARVSALARALVDGDIAMTPTLITLQRKYALRDYEVMRESDMASLMPGYYRRFLWHGTEGFVSSRLFDAEDHAQFEAAFWRAGEILRELHAAGVRLHTGTDAPAEFIVPGAGLLEELRLLVAVGFSPEEALSMSTVGSARSVFGEEAGRLRVGAPADFVVYREDPLQSLDNLESRLTVVSDGRFYSAEALEAQLSVYRQWYDSTFYSSFSNGTLRLMFFLINLFAD